MESYEARLEFARRVLADQERLVAAQKATISSLERAGEPTGVSRANARIDGTDACPLPRRPSRALKLGESADSQAQTLTWGTSQTEPARFARRPRAVWEQVRASRLVGKPHARFATRSTQALDAEWMSGESVLRRNQAPPKQRVH